MTEKTERYTALIPLYQDGKGPIEVGGTLELTAAEAESLMRLGHVRKEAASPSPFRAARSERPPSGRRPESGEDLEVLDGADDRCP